MTELTPPESSGGVEGRAPRRLLVIAYYFPPLGGVGVQRTLKFVRNLRAFGWRSVVLAPADPAYQIRDPELLAEIPGDAEVIRVRCPEPASLVATLARRWRGRHARETGHGARTVAPGPSAARRTFVAAVRSRARFRSLLRSLATWWVRGWGSVLFPDEQALWRRFATLDGRRVHAQDPIDAIFSSSPPVTVHVIARAISRATGRPWVADFRDPWIGNGFAAPVSDRRRRRMDRLERDLVAAADRVVLASPTMAADFRARYPDLGDRFVVIPNGYDPTELDGIVGVPRAAGTYTIVYAGSIYGDRELGLFLAGLERLLVHRPELRDRLRIEFVGRINEPNRRLAETYARPERLGDVVTYLGFLPRRRALAHMRSADALLQIIAADPGKQAVIGGKVPEYLAFDLPILAVVPKGDARAILEELGWGIVADPEPDAVAAGIEQLLAAPPPRGSADPERRYDRQGQARQLAAILDEAVSQR